MADLRQALPIRRELLASAEFFKTFGDPTRLSLLHALRHQELCVCDLAKLLDMTESAISHQLGALRRAGLVKPRRDGKNIYYSLDDGHVEGILDMALEHINEDPRSQS